MYVGGINCSKQNAYAEMVVVQRRFGLRGKVVGYHGIQSFRESEVTPEQAFKIGDHKELRRVSDEICREHGLSVLENSNFYGGHKKDYWRHKMCITALYILIHLRTIDSKALYNGLLHEEHDLQAAAVLQSGYCIVVCL